MDKLPDPRIAPPLSALVRLQHQARGFSFLHRQPVHSLLSGRRASRIRGRGLAFEEIRAYRAGDDVRMIDWRASARTGHTQTRVFTEERDRPILLVVDLSAAMFFGSVRATKSAVAAEGGGPGRLARPARGGPARRAVVRRGWRRGIPPASQPGCRHADPGRSRQARGRARRRRRARPSRRS
jgi:hypothetical protein